MPFTDDHGPKCTTCAGPSTRAVRTRQLVIGGEPVYYLAYEWSCSVCGKTWIDDALERLNACAEHCVKYQHQPTYMKPHSPP